MSKCKCDFRTYMVGDGCEVCNPAKALEYAKETITELEAKIEWLRGALNKIAYERKPGVLNNKLAERYERVAIAALADDGLLHDRCHVEVGRVRPAKSVKVKAARAKDQQP